MATPAPTYRQQPQAFEVSVVPASQLANERFIGSQPLLAAIQYGIREPKSPALACPSVFIPTPQLNEEPLVEIWTSPTAVVTARRHGLHYAANGQALFGVCQLDEPEGGSLEALSYDAYTHILRLVREQGYPYLLRIWNYLSDINAPQGNVERYRRFCVGRYQAFAEHDRDFEKTVAAGSGVGTRTPGMSVYFVAARQAGTPVDNPRQVNAYDYPSQYSPRSPSFSRAMVKHWGAQAQLFLSGTASIVGHQTLHIGDVHEQLSEALRNIRALLEHAVGAAGVTFHTSPTQTVLKVYIRHAEDYPLIRQWLQRELAERLPIIYLHADLCRRELLVEVEGIYTQ